MRIIGHGIDIQDIGRIEKLISTPGRDWIDGVFTASEQTAANGLSKLAQYFAGRYAAKEAVAKAIGTGFSDDVAWLDIEILRTQTGAPEVRLVAGAADAAKVRGVTEWLVSISHSGEFAVASVIGVAQE